MSRKRSPFFHVFVVAFLATGVSLLTHFTGVSERIDLAIMDTLFEIRNRSVSPKNFGSAKDVAVITVTNTDVKKLNRPFPWGRDEQSVIFEKLSALSPSAVAVDLLYPEPTTVAADKRLGMRLADCGKVVAAFYFDSDEERVVRDSSVLKSSGNRMGADFSVGKWPHFQFFPAIPTEEVMSGVARLGHAHSIRDRDGIIRRIPLVVRYGEKLFPSLALQSVILHWGLDWSQVRILGDGIRMVDIPDIGSVTIPLDRAGNMLLDFPPEVETRYEGADVFTLMETELPSFKGRVVCVGSVVTGHGDIHATPVQSETPGILINAIAIEQILGRRFLTESGQISMAIVCFLLTLSASFVFWWVKPLLGGIALSLLLVFTAGATYLVFAFEGYWFPPFGSLLGITLSAGFLSVSHYQNVVRCQRDIVNAFSRYLGPNLGNILSENPAAFDGGPKREVVTVFFSDIVSYTAMSESLESEELIEVLNDYFNTMTDIAFAFEATVSKYIGDGMMVFFNQPMKQPDHASRAVRMALEMRERIPELNREFAAKGLPPFSVRMGINTGYAHVGNVGSTGFSDFTIIGSSVNLAARVMSEAGHDEVFVAERTHALTMDLFNFEDLGKTELKGVQEPENIYRVSSEVLHAAEEDAEKKRERT